MYLTEKQLLKKGTIPKLPKKFFNDFGYKPEKLTLQWHITERCNLKCTHCYQDSKVEELCFDELVMILEQYTSLLKKWGIKGHINITGGEPFVRSDFMSILEQINRYGDFVSYGILSNGTFITRDIAKELKRLNCKFVQVSLEGDKDTNDAIRGEGIFDKVVSTLDILRDAKIHSLVSFTATKKNYREFEKVFEICEKHKVSRVWSDRVIPSGSADVGLMMSKEETKEFFETMYECRAKSVTIPYDRQGWGELKTEVAMYRALQFETLFKNENHSEDCSCCYHCEAGNSLIVIMADGQLVPCRRMPILLGNVLQEPIESIYYNSVIMKHLRNRLYNEGCEECDYNLRCRGGLRCLSYALYNNPFIKDPQCFR
ncbi:MAG: radical SAM protein [Ignavibacteriales bacterium]